MIFCKTEWIMVNQWSFTSKIENWCLCFINKILYWLYLRQIIKISIPQGFCLVWIKLDFHILAYRHSVVGIHYIFISDLLSLLSFSSYWFFCICCIMKAFLLSAILGRLIILLIPQDAFFMSNDGDTSVTFISSIISTFFWHLAVESIYNRCV